jgi:succinyldiaminopimelate transaminase
VELSPVLAELAQYPFTRLDEWKADATARGIELIDFGVGDPRERTPPFIRDAMLRSVPEISSYPKASGLPELRNAISRWIESRYGAYVDPDTEIVPTLGSKEAIFSFAQFALGAKRVVAVPEPAYPVYERGARFAGAEVVTVPLSQRRTWVPDIDTIDFWDEIGMFWICYPNNPTGAVAPFSFYEEMAELAQTHGFLLCSDEAYSELYFDEAPSSALELDDRTNVVVFNTLSKRSSMTGYRSGFMCAPPDLTAAIKQFRPTVGTAPQEFVQKASIAAWSDEQHVKEVRQLYSRKRDVMLPALESKGWLLAGSAATFYLWVDVGGPSEPFARRLLEHGIVCAPGSFFGAAGEGYARFALVPTQAECERAAEIIARHF